ncbi:putative septum formation protein maf [Toxoplasma gondii CAST]|uniref:Putative septum formation protein maf n=1 Tax=Toxoplasma gondii CAST TaxID=943122 RepID=A0A425HML7_TOXGO|nr:putative septum formation protein maf [Toxoplasma gondii CAST]
MVVLSCEQRCPANAAGSRTLLPLLPVFGSFTKRQGKDSSPQNACQKSLPSPEQKLRSLFASSSPCVPPTSSGRPATSAVVLASASVRRLELCRSVLNLDVECRPSDFEALRRPSKPQANGREEKNQEAGERGAAESEEGHRQIDTVSPDEEESLLVKLVETNEARQAQASSKSRASVGWDAELYALKTANGKARSVAREIWKTDEASLNNANRGPPQADDEACCSAQKRQCREGAARSRAGERSPSPRYTPLPPHSIVIGADTIVELDGQILEKPKDEQDARRMLASLSGRTHAVHTAVSLYSRQGGAEHPVAAFVETTKVTMVALGSDDIEAYVRTGEPIDKAGKFFASRLVLLISSLCFSSYVFSLKFCRAVGHADGLFTNLCVHEKVQSKRMPTNSRKRRTTDKIEETRQREKCVSLTLHRPFERTGFLCYASR